MPTLQTVLADARRIVGQAVDERGVDPLGDYVPMALRDLTRLSPRLVRLHITGDGTDEYPLGSDWVRGTSSINRVRWVPDADFNAPAQYLTAEQYEVEDARTTVTSEAVGTGDGSTKVFALDVPYALRGGATVTVAGSPVAESARVITGDADGSSITFTTAPANGAAIVATYFAAPPQIRFSLSPSTADAVIVEFTGRHTLTADDGASSVSDDEAGALSQRVAALLLRAAAASVASTVSQATDTDIVGMVGSQADSYRRLADDADAAFYAALGLAMDAVKSGAAGGPQIVSVPSQPNRRNNYYLTHPRRGGW